MNIRRTALLALVSILIPLMLAQLKMVYAGAEEESPLTAPIAPNVYGNISLISKDGFVSGWAIDPDTSDQPVKITLTVDTPAVSTSSAIVLFTDIVRDDVNTSKGVTGAHGFRVRLPLEYLDNKRHTLYMTMSDSTLGTVVHAKTFRAKSNVLPEGNISIIYPNGEILGWGLDMDTPSDPVTLMVYIEVKKRSHLGVSMVTNWVRDDVNTSKGVTGMHGFRAQLPRKFRDGNTHTAYLYVVDTTTGKKHLVAQRLFTAN